MKNFFWILLLPCWSTAQIIPEPVSIKPSKGTFSITKKTVIVARDAKDRATAALFNDYLREVYGFQLEVNKPASTNLINLTTLKFIKAPEHGEGYMLQVLKDRVMISGNSYAGTFYGMQSLIQLLPVQKTAGSKLDVPLLTVQDYPRFAYRGMHLDVARHFFPVSFVKKYINYLSLHKMNYFHWHLTDDQGWRIEIKKYPRLNEVGAWRNGTIVGRYPGIANDNIRYGGYYSHEEVRDIIQYAADRFITVIPEIEMPGHASAAIASYPWLSCFAQEETIIPSHPSEAGRNSRAKKVQETWGVFDDVFCAGNDSTFSFLQDVIDEILPLFPSKYIHAGGDECPKNNWKRCPKCQARIKALGLKDEHELQSYFIQRMEKHLNSKGKTLIGWDEILEGGLAPNAWVMSWRGEKGGVEAANQNHQVIMTPQKPLYFDHSQTKNEDSIVIGGYNPIEEVYAYDPLPKELSADKTKYIQGAQANLWAEYIKYPGKVEYHIFPRMSALSEVLWSPKSKRNWNSFEKRLPAQFKRYDLWKANYSKAYFDLKTAILPAKSNSGIVWRVSRKDKSGAIRTVQNGTSSIHDKDSIDVPVTANGRYELALVNRQPGANKEFTLMSAPIRQEFIFSKSTGKKATVKTSPTGQYPGQGGAFSLVNGVYSHKGLSYPDWMGWIGDDMEATIDFGVPTSFDSVRMHTLDQNGSWIYLPPYVEVFVSDDGNRFTSAGRSSAFVRDTLTMGWITIPTPGKSSRYIRVVAKNYGPIPQGKPGAGNKAWLFADEIQVY